MPSVFLSGPDVTLNKPLIVILAAVMLDAVGIGLIFPILPGLLREVAHLFDIAPLYGAMLSVYALMQFVFAPVLGALSDRFGRRPVLLISLAGAALDYLLMALTPYMWVLFIGRAIAGLTSANMAVASAYITDISDEDKRAQRFGYMHAMFGIGFIVGPVLGGLLGEFWIRAPFVLAAVLNFANFALAYFVLPESRKGQSQGFEWRQLNPLRPLKWALGMKVLMPFLAVFVILNFVGQVYGSVWVLYGEDALGWSPLLVGLSLAFYGALHALAQMTLPGPAVRRFGERATLLIGLAAEITGLIGFAIIGQGWAAYALMPLFALGGIGVPALQSLTTRAVDADHQGRLQGVLTSLMSLTAVFGPLVFTGGYFASKDWWLGSVWILAAATYVLALPLAGYLRPRHSTTSEPA